MDVEIPIVGMHCASCAANVEKAIRQKVKGVLEASVNLATESATVRLDPESTELESIAAVVQEAGYRAILPSDETVSLSEDEDSARKKEVKTRRQELLVGLQYYLIHEGMMLRNM